MRKDNRRWRVFSAPPLKPGLCTRNHLDALTGISSTKDNLKAAISGERYEYTQMYPPFIKQAEADGDNRAERSFKHANKVEEIHHRRYEQALALVEHLGKPPEGD